LTEPLTIVPSEIYMFENTVIPTTSAGDPTVVNVVPVQLAVKDKPVAADQFVVWLLPQVPVPPTQYLSAIYGPLRFNVPSAVYFNQLCARCWSAF